MWSSTKAESASERLHIPVLGSTSPDGHPVSLPADAPLLQPGLWNSLRAGVGMGSKGKGRGGPTLPWVPAPLRAASGNQQSHHRKWTMHCSLSIQRIYWDLEHTSGKSSCSDTAGGRDSGPTPGLCHSHSCWTALGPPTHSEVAVMQGAGAAPRDSAHSFYSHLSLRG